MSDAHSFLNAELAHAAAQLARVRRIAVAHQQQLAAQGLSELAVYDQLSQSKPYRQLQRDEIVFHQMWLRAHRQLLRLPQLQAQPQPQPPSEKTFDETLAELERQAAFAKPQPYRKPPTPGPNQPCSCGSRVKFKKCCGNPLRAQARAA